MDARQTGPTETGTLYASPRDARDRIELEPEAGDAPSRLRVSRKELISFTTTLATFQRSGVPLMKALDGIAVSSGEGAIASVVEDLSAAIGRGLPFSATLARHPRVFDKFYVSMVEVGEATGHLDQVLTRLAEHIEREADLSAQIKGAAAYPVFSLIMCLAIIAFILVFVVPNFVKVFEDQGVELPMPTQVVIFGSDLILNHFLLVAVVSIALPVSYLLVRNVPVVRRSIDTVKLHLPVTGRLHHKMTLARFSTNLQLLNDSGVPILASLALIRDSVGNVVFSSILRGMSESISRGGTVAAYIEAEEYFPPIFHQLATAGEASGQLGFVFGEIGRFYDKEVQRAVKVMISLMDPMMIVFMGISIGGIIIALFLPMFEMVGSFK